MNPTIPKDAKQKLVAAQLNALVMRLKGGKPLTAEQMRFAEKQFAEATGDNAGAASGADQPDNDDLCASASELARRLGLHRQVIAYHRRLAGAPGCLSESAWREYLAGAGKLPTGIKLERSAAPTFDADTGMASLFNAISAALPVAIRTAAEHSGVKLPRRKLDQLTFDVWLLFAGIYEKLAPRFDATGPFTAVDGQVEYPGAIRRVAARLVTQKKPVKSTVPNQLPAAKQAAA